MQLDTNDSVPLYQQLTDIIIRDIETGKYQVGGKIPTEQELSTAYKVSRVTVRNALAELTERNLLTRRRGKGTYVNGVKINRSIIGVKSFSQVCREMGCRPGAKVIKCVIEKATQEDMEQLNLPADSNIIITERVRFADDVPVSFEISRFPERFSFLLQEDLNNCSMFEIIKQKHGISFVESSKTIELAYATYQMSAYLQIPERHPLLLISSLSSDNAGAPCHRSLQFIVGDKFKLVV